MPLAYIRFIEVDWQGRPVDPGFGVPGSPGYPDQGLPGGGGEIDNALPVPNPPAGQPGHLPSVPPGKPVIPAHPIVRWPPRGETDPDWGVTPVPNPPAGQPGHLPAVPPGWPTIPTHPWVPPRPVRPSHPIHRPWPGPVDPGWGVDEGAQPGQGLPGGNPNFPDNSLPTTPPPSVPPGSYLVLVRSPAGKWQYAVVQSPPTTLPEPPPTAQPKA